MEMEVMLIRITFIKIADILKGRKGGHIEV